MEPGDLATWISSGGTLAAVAVALWLARRDSRQARRRERYQQAEQVTAWLSSAGTAAGSFSETVRVSNASSQSAYDLIVSLVSFSDEFRNDGNASAGYRTYVRQLPPGTLDVQIDAGGLPMSLELAVEIAFRDAAGNVWRRRGSGVLESCPGPVSQIYGETDPLPWGRTVGDPSGEATRRMNAGGMYRPK